MTKSEAIKKISKLRRLAERPGSQAEAENARREIARLAKEHALSNADLTRGIKAEAFDDIVGKLDAFAKRNHDKLPGPVVDVIELVKKEMSEEEKADALEKVVGAVRLATLFLGRKKMGGIKDLVDGALKEHDVTI